MTITREIVIVEECKNLRRMAKIEGKAAFSIRLLIQSGRAGAVKYNRDQLATLE